jgi:hypothetical protein
MYFNSKFSILNEKFVIKIKSIFIYFYKARYFFLVFFKKKDKFLIKVK